MEEGLVLAMIAFALGGILKGAIGAGTPVVAVPIMSLYYGVPFAVSVFALPAVLSNLWQAVQFREHLMPWRFVGPLVAAAALGTVGGAALLVSLPGEFLMGVVALATLVYVLFRAARPNWVLDQGLARRIAVPTGFVAGVLQGAAGISAPASLTFLNAMRLPREVFIATISMFFLSMAVVQFASVWGFGLLTPQRFGISVIACLPLFGAMPVGGWIARFLSREAFDKIVMGLLILLALRLLWKAVLG